VEFFGRIERKNMTKSTKIKEKIEKIIVKGN